MISEIEKMHHTAAIGEDEEFEKRSSASMRFAVFVLFPTLLAAIYYLFIASDIYVSENKFSINVEKQATLQPSGVLASLLPVGGAGHDTIVVKEMLISKDMLDRLEKKVHLHKIYESNNPDILSRPPDATNEDAYLRYFNNMFDVRMDEQSNIISMNVKAFSAKDSKLISDAALQIAEEFVNKMSERMQEDELSFAKEQLAKAEQDVITINNEMAGFRNANNNFNPEVSTKQVLDITTGLEKELATTQTEIASLSNYLKDSSPKLKSLKAKAASIRSQIAAQSSRLASDKGSELADQAAGYEELQIRKDFAMQKYNLALTAYEAAQVEASKKSKYLLRVVGPTLPQEPTEPYRMREVLTFFIAFLIGYTVVSLLIAAIKDHTRP